MVCTGSKKMLIVMILKILENNFPQKFLTLQICLNFNIQTILELCLIWT